MGLTYKIAKWSINKLIKNGADLSEIVNSSPEQVELKNLILKMNNELDSLRDAFNIKRAEIIEEQTNLINMVEPYYMTMLGQSKDSLEQTTMTKLWMDKFSEIDELVDAHEKLIETYNEKYALIESYNKKYEEFV